MNYLSINLKLFLSSLNDRHPFRMFLKMTLLKQQQFYHQYYHAGIFHICKAKSQLIHEKLYKNLINSLMLLSRIFFFLRVIIRLPLCYKLARKRFSNRLNASFVECIQRASIDN